MSVLHLDKMFEPQSLAIIGAGERVGSIGHVLMQNVLAGGFAGAVYPVNPKHKELAGVVCYPDIASLPQAPELAVLCIAPPLVPQAIADLGARGTKAAVVITAGFSEVGTLEGKALEQAMLGAAASHGMRIIGPNCLGVMAPGVKLNATFSHIGASAGRLAFVSQSGALCTSILDYVAGRDIGFSHFVSLGNCSDVDFGDMLEYLGEDENTSAILLYIESISQVAEFMAAARKAAANKPIIVIKSGRSKSGGQAASSHTGALIGSDAVYDVAFKRAGMLRVYSMEELFDSVETLARLRPQDLQPKRSVEKVENRLLIVSNGGGPAVIATDYLEEHGGRLAELSPQTIEAFNAVLPPTWSHHNPVDIIGDADGKRYAAALKVAMQAPDVDAVFVMKCPTAVSDNLECAQAVVEAMRGNGKRSLFTCWLGEATAEESRRLFSAANIATYDMPEKAVRAFLHMAEFRHNQAILRETPTIACGVPSVNVKQVEAMIEKAFAEGRSELFESEAKDVLALYDIPVVKTYRAANEDEAVAMADKAGYPAVLKILSRDISHKSDVGGVILSLADGEAVRQAARSMLANVAKLKPEAKIEGFTVQAMAAKREGYELIIGMSCDRQFGPVLMFGEGGVAVEVIDDKALALPPLSAQLAEDMIKHTRVYKRLKGFRDRKPVNMEAIIDTLLAVSRMVSDVASISELDINPLIVDSSSAVALDARIKIKRADGERLVIACGDDE